MYCARPLLVFPLLLTCLSAAQADQASKNAKIEEMFRVSRVDQMLKQTISMSMNQMKSGFYQQLFGFSVPEDQRQTVAEFQDKLQKLLNQALSWESVEPAYVKIFSDAYTEEEIEGILAFYKSPAGQALLTKAPQLMAQGSQLAQERMKAIQPQLQQLMTEYEGRLKPGASKGAPAKQ